VSAINRSRLAIRTTLELFYALTCTDAWDL